MASLSVCRDVICVTVEGYHKVLLFSQSGFFIEYSNSFKLYSTTCSAGARCALFTAFLTSLKGITLNLCRQRTAAKALMLSQSN
jgi:hypothetical protein